MADDDIKLLMQSLAQHLSPKSGDPAWVAKVLTTETVRFRDKLKEETGTILTVADARTSLDALEHYLDKLVLPRDLTAEQKALAQIWIDRLSTFKDRS